MTTTTEISLIPTLIFILVTTYTPGPNNLIAGSMGAFYGYKRSIPLLSGIAVGFFLIMLISFLLSSMLSSQLPAIVPVLRIIGAMYILWLAKGIYLNSSLMDNTTKTKPLGFVNGLLLQFVNPKAVIYGLTIFSTFLAPTLKEPTSYAFLPVLLAGVSFSSITVWALGGQLIRRSLHTPKRMKIFGAILAAALVYTAIDLLEITSFLSAN